MPESRVILAIGNSGLFTEPTATQVEEVEQLRPKSVSSALVTVEFHTQLSPPSEVEMRVG
jgi:hypothetical protein